MDNTDFKKGFFGFGLGILLFYIGYRAFTQEEEAMPVQPPITQENVNLAIGAYKAALADKADTAKLAELNKELAKQFGLRLQLGMDNKIAVYDLSGKKIQTV